MQLAQLIVNAILGSGVIGAFAVVAVWFFKVYEFHKGATDERLAGLREQLNQKTDMIKTLKETHAAEVQALKEGYEGRFKTQSELIEALKHLNSPYMKQILDAERDSYEKDREKARQEIEKLRTQVQEITEEASRQNNFYEETEAPPEIYNTIASIQEALEADPLLSLAKLRIALEKILNKLQRLTPDSEEITGSSQLQQLLDKLSSNGVIPESISKPLHDVIFMSNQALHGKEIPLLEARSIVEIGVSLLNRLYWHSREFFLEPSKQVIVSSLEVDQYREATYRLVSIIPYIENPVRNVRLLTQEDLDDFFEGYHEYAEFIIELTKIEPKPNI
jgi:gas vesicle protein